MNGPSHYLLRNCESVSASPLGQQHKLTIAHDKIRYLEGAWQRALQSLTDVDAELAAEFISRSETWRRGLIDLRRDLLDLRLQLRPAVAAQHAARTTRGTEPPPTSVVPK